MKSKRLVILFLSLFALMLAACGEVKQEVWLIGNEQWKLDLALTLNSQEYSAIGATLDKQMADSQAKARQEGADFTWSKRRESGGGATYTVSVKGRGLDTLNEAAFDNQARLTRDRSGQVNLSWTPTSKSGSRGYTLVLHGGKIISSNATEQRGNTATWRNPTGRIEAVLTEGSEINLWLIAGALACVCLIGLVVIAGVVVAFVLVRRRKQPAAVA